MGLPTVFVRLTGCPLRCQYCDTAYAFHGGQWQDIADIVRQVREFNAPYVTVTGGEPLAQKRCLSLLQELCDAGFSVSLETSGALDISEVDSRVSRVLDLKTPGSGEQHRNLMANLSLLTAHDQLKFVICNRLDYEWSRKIVQQHRFPDGMEILFSPSHKELDAAELANWILADGLNVRMQLQMHKFIWGDQPGH